MPKVEPAPEFEVSLADYMARLQLPPAQAAHVQALIRRHDFSSARAHLVPSVPGWHKGGNCTLFSLGLAGVVTSDIRRMLTTTTNMELSQHSRYTWHGTRRDTRSGYCTRADVLCSCG